MAISKQHILVIDDNEGIQEAVTAILQYEGYRVSAHSGISDCYETIQLLRPNLILLDKVLLGTDGCAICNQIKTDTDLSAIKVIMFSANAHIKNECFAVGADGFLEKPFELNNLMGLVRLYLYSTVAVIDSKSIQPFMNPANDLHPIP